ncbi:MAG TPA: hypothetical protein VFT66_00695 [Roseiflexaceae bacterium]|nr:hypothetical protein [Roseiflexaceae bacterium]
MSYDDAFITYRYAYNLATGQGFVYNPGEWFMGTTAPFYGLLLGALGWLFGAETIPTISGVISGLSLVLAGVALYVYGRLHEQPLCGLLAGLFFVCNPLLPPTFGGEMLFQVALIAWIFVLYHMERTCTAAFLLALAVLTRMDSVIALGVIGLYDIITKRRVPWREGIIIGLTLLPFALLSWWFYGAFFPVTFGAKIAQRQSGLWPPYLSRMRDWISAFTIQGSSRVLPHLPAAPHAIRFIYFVLMGIPALVFFRFWLLPLAWVMLYVLGYVILDVPFYHWYVVPIIFGLMIVAACGVAGLVELLIIVARQLRRTPQTALWARRGLSILVVAALLPGLIAFCRYTAMLAASPNIGRQLYEKTGHWLAENTPSGSNVGYFEIGFIGYYGHRTMVDPLGLLDPEIVPHVAQTDLTWAYEQRRPDYIIQNQLIFTDYIGKVVEEAWFKREYREIAQINEPGYPPLIIYQRISP